MAGEFLGAGLPASARAPGSFEAYLAFLGTLDIGLAILGDTAFARGRSDGKFLEYASRGAVCVASRAGEYRHGLRDGETGLLFDGPQALHDHLDSLMDDVALRLRLRAAAHAHVRAHRTHAAAAAERARRYGALLVQVPGWGHLPRDPAGTLHSLQDPTEARFLEGTLLHRSGQLHEALQAYLDVVSTHPGFHEPWSRGSSIARRLGAQGDAGLFEQMALRAMHAQLLSS